MARAQGSRLSRADWVVAALGAMRDGGLAAVAVEPLATRLGATKGSFYWHFRDREDLIGATLAHWEVAGTDQVIATLDAAPDPAARLRLLTQLTLAPQRPDLSVVLMDDAQHPLVAATLERATRRRTEYLTEQLLALGLDEQQARARSLLAYTAFLGLSQLRRHLPGTVESVSTAAYLDVLDRALLG